MWITTAVDTCTTFWYLYIHVVESVRYDVCNKVTHYILLTVCTPCPQINFSLTSLCGVWLFRVVNGDCCWKRWYQYWGTCCHGLEGMKWVSVASLVYRIRAFTAIQTIDRHPVRNVYIRLQLCSLCWWNLILVWRYFKVGCCVFTQPFVYHSLLP